MYCKLFASAFVALLMTAAPASAGSYYPWHSSYSDCSGGSGGCQTPEVIFSDNFNRSNSYTVGNGWYGHEDSSYRDISIYYDKMKIGAQDPQGGSTNSSWAIHNAAIPTNCCVDSDIVKLTLSFNFKGWNTDTDDYLVVSWGVPTGSQSPNTNPLANILQTYQLGGSSNTTTLSDSFTFAYNRATLGDMVAFEFAVNIGGCGSSSCTSGHFEGIKLDDVKLVLDCPTSEIPKVPLPASLPLFVSGLGALGFVGWRRKKRMSQQAGATA